MNKNYVVLLAGGVGSRLGASIPKQFLEVNGKPIIVYTIEIFERNTQIDSIVVVCKKEWIDYLKVLLNKYNLTKIKWVIEGGDCSHNSIRNGVFFLLNKIEKDDYVIIHDAVRPMISQDIINDLIKVAHDEGNACSSMVPHAPIVIKDDEKSATKDISRESVMFTASPQMFRFDKLFECYQKADKEGKSDFTFTSSLFIHYGERVYFSKGSNQNIKITTKEDLVLFEALLKSYKSNL